jgi:hypothetical protein
MPRKGPCRTCRTYRGPLASTVEAAPGGLPLSGMPKRNELGEGSPPAPADLATLDRPGAGGAS